MIWATVTILTPCSAENFSRSGTRAIVPSTFMISQITPAGLRPAIRERSTAATGAGPQREDVARHHQVLGVRGRVHGDPAGVRPVGGRDACGDAVLGLDR